MAVMKGDDMERPFDGFDAVLPPPAPAPPPGAAPAPLIVPPRPPLPRSSAPRSSLPQAPHQAPQQVPHVATAASSLGDTARLDADLATLGLTGMPVVDGDVPKPPAPLWQRVSTWVAVYGVALALIGFWPQHVDSGAGPFLRLITKLFPLLTYPRIEFGSNILLFVPLGVGLALLLPRLRYLVMPLALLTSLTIESVQAIYLAGRTPSVNDIIANVSGAALGLVIAVLFEAWRRRRQRA